jgi:hypothetical protein
MRKYFVWTDDLKQVIDETVSGKRKSLASNSDSVVSLFSRAAAVGEHYYTTRVKMYELSRGWKNIAKSGIFRRLERTEDLWKNVGLIFTAVDLVNAANAPTGSIITPTFDIGGYGFEITKPTDPDYSEALSRLPGAT